MDEVKERLAMTKNKANNESDNDRNVELLEVDAPELLHDQHLDDRTPHVRRLANCDECNEQSANSKMFHAEKLLSM